MVVHTSSAGSRKVNASTIPHRVAGVRYSIARAIQIIRRIKVPGALVSQLPSVEKIICATTGNKGTVDQ